MKVNYAGTVPLSTLDWGGKAAITLFFRGCPLRCPYCQNHPYIEELETVEIDLVKKQIRSSSPFVSSVVFSGGEPLMQKAVLPLAEYAKGLGLLVGVHTNGCYPEIANELVKRKLVDKFFIDIKAPPNDPELYGKVTGCGKNGTVKKTPQEIIASLKETIEIAESSGLELELRTTVIRNFIGSEEDIASIATWISKNVKNSEVIYVLQQGIPEHGLEESLRKTRILERDEMLELGKTAKSFLINTRIRTKEAGEEVI